MKKLSLFGSILVLSLLLGMGITLFIPQDVQAVPTCTATSTYKIAIGDCTFKCQPGYFGTKYAIYAGYYSFYDPITHEYVWGPCDFQGYYCACTKDYVPHQDPIDL
ncbi:MAG TPA: hypothetical protein ENH23_05420 [candidate division Zixibacteria bacterium]|nr:hypothetical protein [candidate division Zixibacteria bacterium]